MSIDAGAQVAIILLACRPCVVIVNCLGQVFYLGRVPRTKETLPDFHECRVGYLRSTSIPRVDGLSTDNPVLGCHTWPGRATRPSGRIMAHHDTAQWGCHTASLRARHNLAPATWGFIS